MYQYTPIINKYILYVLEYTDLEQRAMPMPQAVLNLLPLSQSVLRVANGSRILSANRRHVTIKGMRASYTFADLNVACNFPYADNFKTFNGVIECASQNNNERFRRNIKYALYPTEVDNRQHPYKKPSAVKKKHCNCQI